MIHSRAPLALVATASALTWALVGCGDAHSTGTGSHAAGSTAPASTAPASTARATTPVGTAISGMVSRSGDGTESTLDPHVAYALKLVNEARTGAGLPALTYDAALSATALRHAQGDPVPSAWIPGGVGPCHAFLGGDTGGALAENADEMPIGANVFVPGLGMAFIADQDEAFQAVHQSMVGTMGQADLQNYPAAGGSDIGPTPWAGPTLSGRYGNLMNPTYTTIGLALYLQSDGMLVVIEDLR